MRKQAELLPRRTVTEPTRASPGKAAQTEEATDGRERWCGHPVCSGSGMHQAFTVQDLYLHHKITELHCAPGLDLAACTVRSADRDNDSYVSHVWAFRLDGSMGRQ